MSFAWPFMLVLLAAIPFVAWADREIGRRRWRRAGALGGLARGDGPSREAREGPPAGARSSAPGRARRRLRTRVPAMLFLAAAIAMVVALARPMGTLGLPVEQGTVILAFDVSGSMAATDLKPTRMDAAKAAAKAFVERQPPGIAIGVVAFSDSGLSVQVPTTDPAAVEAAIARLQPQKGTSLAEGIQASLDAISVAESGSSVDYYTNRSASPSPSPTPAPVPPGSHGSAVIVLLTDGENNERPDPVAAARAAADRGIRIDAVGIGSEQGAVLDIGGFRVHTQLDAALLRQVADLTKGSYYAADSASGLLQVYDTLDPKLVVTPQQIELTGVVAGLGLLLVLAGGVTSLAWLGRLP